MGVVVIFGMYFGILLIMFCWMLNVVKRNYCCLGGMVWG